MIETKTPILFELPASVHRAFKAQCAARGITMKAALKKLVEAHLQIGGSSR